MYVKRARINPAQARKRSCYSMTVLFCCYEEGSVLPLRGPPNKRVATRSATLPLQWDNVGQGTLELVVL